jgi:hypothetical protein
MMRTLAALHVLMLLLPVAQLARAQVPPPQAESPAPLAPPAEPAPASPPGAPVTDGPAAESPAAPPPSAAPPASQPPPPIAPTPALARPAPVPVAAAPADRDRGADAPRKPSKLFLSAGVGGGYFHATSGNENDTRRFAGGSLALQLVLAGRTGNTRTVTVGGAYLRDQVFGLAAHDEVIDGDEPTLEEVAFGLWLLGLFVDVAVQSVPGLHFQGVAGFSGIQVSAPDRDSDSPFGIALNLGVGYDFQVTQRLAVGALLRNTFAPLSVDEANGTDVSTLAPSLLLTATIR